MSEEELRGLVEVVLGLHNTRGEADTIMHAARAYAAQAVAADRQQRGDT